MTALYSILHFLVDGVCAFAMFGYFSTQDNWYLNVLLYNFCAFAMQMPLGVVLDGLNDRERLQKYNPSFCFAVLGVVLTLTGAFTHPVVLGLGNALFHLGGGVGTIHEDQAKDWKGRGLGVFVAPGALGLYKGTQLAKSGITGWTWILSVGVAMFICLEWGVQILQWRHRMQAMIGAGYAEGEDDQRQEVSVAGHAEGKDDRRQEVTAPKQAERGLVWLMLGCLAVVILRSYIGMSVSFSWKTTLLAGTIAVLAVVFGKVAGGFAAAGFGTRRTVVGSLILAAICYLFSGSMIAGVVALFLFNMTMPITLYLLVQKLKGLPGFAFGLLTFGLFLGFLPVYFGVKLPVDGGMLGCVGSLVSLVILWVCVVRSKAGTEPEAYEKIFRAKMDMPMPEKAQPENMAEGQEQEVG